MTDQTTWNRFLNLSNAVDLDGIWGANVLSYDRGHWNANGHRELATFIEHTVGFHGAGSKGRQ